MANGHHQPCHRNIKTCRAGSSKGNSISSITLSSPTVSLLLQGIYQAGQEGEGPARLFIPSICSDEEECHPRTRRLHFLAVMANSYCKTSNSLSYSGVKNQIWTLNKYLFCLSRPTVSTMIEMSIFFCHWLPYFYPLISAYKDLSAYEPGVKVLYQTFFKKNQILAKDDTQKMLLLPEAPVRLHRRKNSFYHSERRGGGGECAAVISPWPDAFVFI